MVDATRVTTPPTIDGSVQTDGSCAAATECWYRTDRLWFPQARDRALDANLGSLWRLTWDQKALYVQVRVSDTIAVQASSRTPWRGDVVHLRIGPVGAADLGTTREVFLIPAVDGDGTTARRASAQALSSVGGQAFDNYLGDCGIAAASIHQPGKGYVIEAAIPWSCLDLIPSPGTRFAAALVASDNDRPGNTVQELMTSNAPLAAPSDRNRPRVWGSLTLLG